MASGGPYSIQSDLGAPIAGVGESTDVTVRFGYAGQLYEAVELWVAVGSTNLDEEISTQLVAVVWMDDGTRMPLAGDQAVWRIIDGPVQHLGAGQVQADPVYENKPANIEALWQSVSGQVAMLVRDVDPDNFGSYAGDGLPDGWQVDGFGLDNPDAAPDADPFGTGQNNRFKYVAGLDPSDSNSVFRLEIQSGTNGPLIVFNPRFVDRNYAVQGLDDLSATNWQALTESTIEDEGETRTVEDHGGGPLRFYRVRIHKP